MKTKFYESDYEEAFMEVLEQNGWITSNALKLHRQETEALIESDLREFLKSQAKSLCSLTEDEIKRIIANLRNTEATKAYLTLRSIFTLYRDGFIFSRDDTSLPDMHVKYIDFDEPAKNSLIQTA